MFCSCSTLCCRCITVAPKQKINSNHLQTNIYLKYKNLALSDHSEVDVNQRRQERKAEEEQIQMQIKYSYFNFLLYSSRKSYSRDSSMTETSVGQKGLSKITSTHYDKMGHNIANDTNMISIKSEVAPSTCVISCIQFKFCKFIRVELYLSFAPATLVYRFHCQ